jgi:hypothetical protein
LSSVFGKGGSMIPHTLCHCEKRLKVTSISTQLRLNLNVTSDEAISLHRLTEESFLGILQKPLHYKVRAGRLLRGCSNNQLNKVQMYIRRKLAMTKVWLMV